MQTRANAPGKVLITGGYLVLEQQYAGLVLSSTARFHTSITAQQDAPICICVESPQYHNLNKYEYQQGGKLTNYGKHLYVENVLLFCMTLVEQVKGATALHAVHIKIEADNDFYSQRENVSKIYICNVVF